MNIYKNYDLLGLKKENNPSQKEIKNAYHKLALKNHPDKNPNNPTVAELFKEITNAYSILSDESKKKQYDMLGDNNYENGMNMSNDINPEDIFAQFFGRGNHGHGNGFERMSDNPFANFGFNFDIGSDNNFSLNKKCQNINKNIQVTLDDVYNGINNKMKIFVKKNCLKCKKICDNCNGKGHIKQIRSMGILTQISEGPCDVCRGKGEINNKNINCIDCKGTGEYSKESLVNLVVEAGFPNNYKTLFKGLGEQPKTSKQTPGDLIIQLNILDNINFKRQDNDLYYKYKISYIDTIIGKNIEIEYFDEKIKLNTSEYGVLLNGKQYKLEKKGLPYFNKNKRGDMYIEFIIETPKIKNKDRLNELKVLLTDIFD